MSSQVEVAAPEIPGGILELSEVECWRLLQSATLGRLAIVVAGRPEIFPMNYAVSSGSVLFRSADGSKVKHGAGSVAAFEIDGYAPETGTGWSVVVQGRLDEITGRTDAAARALLEISVHPFAAGRKDHVLALRGERVTGRRFSWGAMAPRLAFLGEPTRP